MQEPMTYASGQAFARSADLADPLRHFRDAFVTPDPRDGYDCVYLCGNSLGLQPKRAQDFVDQEMATWGSVGVQGHFNGERPWVSYHRNSREDLATLCGAQALEVASMNSLTVNLHLMLASFYTPDEKRYKVVIESTAFPSDRFAVMSQIRMRGFDPQDALIQWSPRAGETDLRIEDLAAIFEENGDQIALLLLPGIQYYNGQLLDMAALCDLAKAHGCRIGLDLAHAIGNVPLELHHWSPDFAVWCSYKYLNSGPGAVGGIFVPERHFGSDGSEQLLGWWGHDEATRLQMSDDFVAENGSDLWQVSCPSVLSQAPLLASLELFAQAGMPALREKSLHLSGYLEYLLKTEFSGRAVSITPPNAKGAQISITIVQPDVDPKSVFEGLEERNAIVDWREPNVIRVAPAPLYNSYSDVYEFCQRLDAELKQAD